MSYILDALRKSENERHQGKVPDLGRQLQMIHRPAARRWPLLALLVAGLLLNAGLLAYIFWPAQFVFGLAGDEPVASADVLPAVNSAVALTDAADAKPPTAAEAATALITAPPMLPVTPSPVYQPPTVIVPSGYNPDAASYSGSGSWNQASPLASAAAGAPGNRANNGGGNGGDNGRDSGRERSRIPHLVELPLSFQRSVPDLTVNSHIFASLPQARRVMINNHNLRPGDSMQGLRVEQITEDGVVLSKHGQSFRLGIVRDWVSPR